jgi:hypothetical protein
MEALAAYTENLVVLKDRIDRQFSTLSAAELSEVSDADRWSVAQCLQHIIKTNQSYFPVLELVAQDTFRPNFWQRNSPFTKTIGRNLTSELGAVVRKKYKAPRIFMPVSRDIPVTVVQDLLDNVARLSALSIEITTKNRMNTVISSPVSALITFTVGDAISMLIGHSERHLMQAQSLLKKK